MVTVVYILSSWLQSSFLGKMKSIQEQQNIMLLLLGGCQVL